jgi:hypothetical protein
VNLKAGTKLRCEACPAEVVVVRGPESDLVLTCGGAPLGPQDASTPSDHWGAPDSIGVVLGKRYTDPQGRIELLCTKAGAGPLACDGEQLELRGAKPLPSSD